MADRPRFHLAIPVHDIALGRAFYGGTLQCPEGRSADTWVDFDFFDHQLVIHHDATAHQRSVPCNDVDGKQVPAGHFGVLLGRDEWQALADRLKAAGVDFLIEPGVRHAGEPGEQATFFILDPSGNALEFKSMTHPENVFAV